MDPKQRDHTAATPTEPAMTIKEEDRALEPPALGEGAVSARLPRPRMALKQAASAESSMSSNVRKAQVRAALFRKLEPIRIGRFILLEPLGAGAMGEIYAAYDDQLDRKVALKLVKNGSSLTAKADERLLREAQTLAQVSHPNVVQIYEAGTYNGRLFIAMELIRGKTLTSWLKDAAQVPRAVRQREILRQFIAAGRGLEAAHAAGVAHRDFKPDNVLVGDDGRVRVVDFGLARALVDEPGDEASAWSGGALDDDSIEAGTPTLTLDEISLGETVTSSDRETSDGAPSAGQVVGAQSARGSAALDGVATQLDSTPATAPAPIPRAATGEPLVMPAMPARPAMPGRASTSDPSSSAPKLKAAVRLTETGTVMGTPSYMAPETLRGAIADRRSDQFSFCVALYQALYDAFPFSGRSLRELRDAMESGEVAFASGVPVAGYVRKALYRGLSVSPAQRFASMGELLAALEPRTRRRRGWIAVAVSLFAVVLGAGYLRSRAQVDPCAAAGTGIDEPWSGERQGAIHAAFGRSELPFAEATWRGVKARVDGYTGHWRDEATAACQATHVAHMQSAEQLDKRMLCLDRGRRQLAALASELGTGAPDTVEHAIEATEALPELDACRRTENLLFGLAPPPPAVAAKVVAIRDQLARALTLERLGRFEESLAIARDASAQAKGLGYLPVDAEAHAQIARALDGRGTAEARAEAEPLYFEALDTAEAERHDQLAVEIWNRLVLLAVRQDAGLKQAHAWWQRNAAAVRRVGGNDADQARLHHMLGEIYYRESAYAKAADEERAAIATLARVPSHQLELSRYDDGLAKSLDRMDDFDEAIRLHERALAIATEALGAGHPDVIKRQLNYGHALEKHGQLDRARSVLEDALAKLPTRYRDSHPDAGRIHGFLSEVAYYQGQLDRAAEHARASLAIYQRALPPGHVLLAEAYTNLANAESKRRNFHDALAMYEDALALNRRHLGDDHYQTGLNEGNVAEMLVELARYDEAMTHLVEAERIFQHSSGRERETQAWVLTVRGEILAGQGQLGAAIPVLEQALKLFDDNVVDPGNRVLAMWTLARALHGLGRDADRVHSLAEGAHELFAAQGVDGAHNRDVVARFLEQLPAPQGARSSRPRRGPTK
jgi:serine/threonine protein kinase/tetratricopeptide (TPR) repeat protein